MDSSDDDCVSDLFVGPEAPMYFVMQASGAVRQKVKTMVENNGGILTDNLHMDHREHMIRLVVSGEITIKREMDSFDYKYIKHCVTEKRILPNLIDYRVNRNSPFQEYDPVSVLTRQIKWSDVPRRVEGEVVSDLEFVSIENDNQYKVFKSSRMPYTYKEKLKIIQEIQRRKAYNLVKGNIVWQRMEGAKFDNGRRTWQSLRNHFNKTILPGIRSFGLAEEEVRKFLHYSSKDARSSSESESDKDIFEEDEEESNLVPPIPKESDSEEETSSTSKSPVKKPGSVVSSHEQESRYSVSDENRNLPQTSVDELASEIPHRLEIPENTRTEPRTVNPDSDLEGHAENTGDESRTVNPDPGLGGPRENTGTEPRTVNPEPGLEGRRENTGTEPRTVNPAPGLEGRRENTGTEPRTINPEPGLEGHTETKINDKTDELYKTAVESDADFVFYQESEILRESRTNFRKRYLMDVGDDPELEQLMNETRIPEELIGFNSVSEAGGSRIRKKRRLYSKNNSFLSECVDDRTLSVPSPVIRGNHSIPEEPELETPSSAEFAAGLSEATGEGLDGESQPVIFGGLTSTQKLFSDSPDVNQKSGLGTALAVGGSCNPEELQLFLQDSSELQPDIGDNQLRIDEEDKELSEKTVEELRELEEEDNGTLMPESPNLLAPDYMVDNNQHGNHIFPVFSTQILSQPHMDHIPVIHDASVSSGLETIVDNPVLVSEKDAGGFEVEVGAVGSDSVLASYTVDIHTVTDGVCELTPRMRNIRVNVHNISKDLNRIAEGHDRRSFDVNKIGKNGLTRGDNEDVEIVEDDGITEGRELKEAEQDDRIKDRDSGKTNEETDVPDNTNDKIHDRLILNKSGNLAAENPINTFEDLEGLIPERREDISRDIISSENEISEAESQDSDVLRRVRNPTRFQNTVNNQVARDKSKKIAVYVSGLPSDVDSSSDIKQVISVNNLLKGHWVRQKHPRSGKNKRTAREIFDLRSPNTACCKRINSANGYPRRRSSVLSSSQDDISSTEKEEIWSSDSSDEDILSRGKRGKYSKNLVPSSREGSRELEYIDTLDSSMESLEEDRRDRRGGKRPVLKQSNTKDQRYYSPEPQPGPSRLGDIEPEPSRLRNPSPKPMSLGDVEPGRSSPGDLESGQSRLDDPEPGPSRLLNPEPDRNRFEDQTRINQKDPTSVKNKKDGSRKGAKAKLIIIGKENEAPLKKAKFRDPYTFAEEKSIVQYLELNGGFSRIKGTALWKNMVEDGVAPGRTWQSIKQRFLAHILDSLGAKVKDRLQKADRLSNEAAEKNQENDEEDEDEDEDEDDEDNNDKEKAKKKIKKVKRLYTKSEDKKILAYISENKRYEDTGGNAMWIAMAEKKIVKNRSWESMKERFKKVLSHNLEKYDLDEEILLRFKGGPGGKVLQRRYKK